MVIPREKKKIIILPLKLNRTRRFLQENEEVILRPVMAAGAILVPVTEFIKSTELPHAPHVPSKGKVEDSGTENKKYRSLSHPFSKIDTSSSYDVYVKSFKNLFSCVQCLGKILEVIVHCVSP